MMVLVTMKMIWWHRFCCCWPQAEGRPCIQGGRGGRWSFWQRPASSPHPSKLPGNNHNHELQTAQKSHLIKFEMGLSWLREQWRWGTERNTSCHRKWTPGVGVGGDYGCHPKWTPPSQSHIHNIWWPSLLRPALNVNTKAIGENMCRQS